MGRISWTETSLWFHYRRTLNDLTRVKVDERLPSLSLVTHFDAILNPGRLV